jgi:hypothetical protein
MTLLTGINVTFDVYTGFNPADPCTPPNRPARLQKQQGLLQHHVDNGRFGLVPAGAQPLYHTSVLDLSPGTDVREAWNNETNSFNEAGGDTVVVYDYPALGVCTPFVVVLVQRQDRGGPGDYLRVYLDRARPCYAPRTCPDPNATGVSVSCCSAPVPHTLHATLTCAACPELNGSWPLTYQPPSGQPVCYGIVDDAPTFQSKNGRWYGSRILSCGLLATLNLVCCDTGAVPFGAGWGFDTRFFIPGSALCAGGTQGLQKILPQPTCPPFVASFTWTVPALAGVCACAGCLAAGGTIGVVITP